MENQRDFTTLIVEDNTMSGLKLKDLLTDHYPHARVEGIASSLQEARNYIKENTLDLLFLDIELPDGNGFDLLSELPEVHFEVIVTTSHSNYMLEAIRHSALDFLIKPVTKEDLDHAMQRFAKSLNQGKHLFRTKLVFIPGVKTTVADPGRFRFCQF